MNVTNGQVPTADMNEEEMQEDWSEEKYIAGLAQLERLQNQVSKGTCSEYDLFNVHGEFD